MDKLILHSVQLPIGAEEKDWDKIEAVDLVPTYEYYPFFIRHTSKLISPARYLEEIVHIVCKDGARRTKILQELADYMGSNFRFRLETYHRMYEALKEK